jgi:hypothetical protein
MVRARRRSPAQSILARAAGRPGQARQDFPRVALVLVRAHVGAWARRVRDCAGPQGDRGLRAQLLGGVLLEPVDLHRRLRFPPGRESRAAASRHVSHRQRCARARARGPPARRSRPHPCCGQTSWTAPCAPTRAASWAWSCFSSCTHCTRSGCVSLSLGSARLAALRSRRAGPPPQRHSPRRRFRWLALSAASCNAVLIFADALSVGLYVALRLGRCCCSCAFARSRACAAS